MMSDVFSKPGIVSLNIKGMIGKPLIPVLAKFKGFLSGQDRLYAIKPSSNANDYTKEELRMFSAFVTDSLKKGIIHSNAMSRLILFAEADISTGAVGMLTFADATVADEIPTLLQQLNTDRIVELVM